MVFLMYILCGYNYIHDDDLLLEENEHKEHLEYHQYNLHKHGF